MTKDQYEILSGASSGLQDLIASAGIDGLKEIDQALDDLKSIIEDNMMALAGHGGDY